MTLLGIMYEKQFDESKIEFRPLTREDEQEMKELHAEWFPIDYP